MPDPITHLTIGFVAARHFFNDYKILFLCACMVPDIDGLFGLLYIFFFLPEGAPGERMAEVFEAFHPSLPASLFFLPFFAAIVVFLFRWVKPGWVPVSFKRAYLLVLTAILLHLGLDMLMTGNRPFWPLSFEAGLGIIPYSIWGVFVPMVVGVSLVILDWVFSRWQTMRRNNAG